MSYPSYAVSRDEHVIGFDTAAGSNWCSPSFMGFNFCISATTSGSSTSITIQLNTPLGSYTKTFSISSNICFNWGPIPVVSLQVCVSNYSVTSTQTCLTLGVAICVSVPIIGQKCSPQMTNTLCIPLPGLALHDQLAANKLSDQDLVLALLLAHHAEGSGACNCK